MTYVAGEKAITPAFIGVSHRFRAAMAAKLGFSEEGLCSAKKSQQEEIDYLLAKRDAILKRVDNSQEVTSRLDDLAASTQIPIMDDAVAFQVRENLLNKLNAAIIRQNINPLNNKNLICSNCYLTRFNSAIMNDPVLIGHWPTLKTLDLNNNQIKTLPAEIVQLAALETFYLEHNQLTAVPAEIGQLAALRILRLSNNRLAAVPDQLGQLAALERLYLEHNQLTTVPAQMGQLAALKHLTIGHNKLTTLPTEICQLTVLEILNLEHNQLTEGPLEMGKLKALEELNLGHNRLSTLSAQIGQLAALKALGLGHNQLTAVPAEIGQLAALGCICLNHNQLTQLSDNLRGDILYICEDDTRLSKSSKAEVLSTQRLPQNELVLKRKRGMLS